MNRVLHTSVSHNENDNSLITFKVEGGDPTKHEPHYWQIARGIEANGPIEMTPLELPAILFDFNRKDGVVGAALHQLCKGWRLKFPITMPTTDRPGRLADFLNGTGATGEFFPLFQGMQSKQTDCEMLYLETIDLENARIKPLDETELAALWPDELSNYQRQRVGFKCWSYDRPESEFYYLLKHNFFAFNRAHEMRLSIVSSEGNIEVAKKSSFSLLRGVSAHYFECMNF